MMNYMNHFTACLLFSTHKRPKPKLFNTVNTDEMSPGFIYIVAFKDKSWLK